MRFQIVEKRQRVGDGILFVRRFVRINVDRETLCTRRVLETLVGFCAEVVDHQVKRRLRCLVERAVVATTQVINASLRHAALTNCAQE